MRKSRQCMILRSLETGQAVVLGEIGATTEVHDVLMATQIAYAMFRPSVLVITGSGHAMDLTLNPPPSYLAKKSVNADTWHLEVTGVPLKDKTAAYTVRMHLPAPLMAGVMIRAGVTPSSELLKACGASGVSLPVQVTPSCKGHHQPHEEDGKPVWFMPRNDVLGDRAEPSWRSKGPKKSSVPPPSLEEEDEDEDESAALRSLMAMESTRRSRR